MTSGPMPSPGMTAIRNGIGYSIIGRDLEKVFDPLADTLHSADGRKGLERGAGQDAPPSPGSTAFGAYLLGGLGIRRPGLSPTAGRRHRRARVQLEPAPTVPQSGRDSLWSLRSRPGGREPAGRDRYRSIPAPPSTPGASRPPARRPAPPPPH